jgi:hypothetical protein
MLQDWWKSDPVANQPQAAPRPLIPRRRSSRPPQTPDQAALTQGQVQRLPIENAQTRASTASTIANMGQIPIQNENTRTNIAQGQTSIRTSLQGAEQQLRDDFEKRPEVQQFRVVLPQYAPRSAPPTTRRAISRSSMPSARSWTPARSCARARRQMAGTSAACPIRCGLSRPASGRRAPPAAAAPQLLGEIRNRAAGWPTCTTRPARNIRGSRSSTASTDAIIGPHPAIPYQQAEADFVGHPIKNGNGFTYPKGYQGPQGGNGPRARSIRTGEGDIGFNNHADAAALPERAQEFPKRIRSAAGKAADELNARAAGHHPISAAGRLRHRSAAGRHLRRIPIAKGIMPVRRRTAEKPDISSARQSGFSNIPIAALPGATDDRADRRGRARRRIPSRSAAPTSRGCRGHPLQRRHDALQPRPAARDRRLRRAE